VGGYDSGGMYVWVQLCTHAVPGQGRGGTAADMSVPDTYICWCGLRHLALQAEHLIPPNASFIARIPTHSFTRELWDLWQPGGRRGRRKEGGRKGRGKTLSWHMCLFLPLLQQQAPYCCPTHSLSSSSQPGSPPEEGRTASQFPASKTVCNVMCLAQGLTRGCWSLALGSVRATWSTRVRHPCSTRTQSSAAPSDSSRQ
jgi:hypothetical protein